jgi:SAM-dependent methyltransferase
MTHAHTHTGSAPFDDERLVAIIAAEGEAAGGLTARAIARTCAALGWSDRTRVERIADLGSGPGVDACALATAFPAATVAAVDDAPAMRAATTRRAAAAGLAGRVEGVALSLDGDLAALGPLDLAWAALSLHHLRDVDATLRAIAARLRPGGGLCVLERHTPPRLRPADDLGRPGLWERVDDALSARDARDRAAGHAHDDLDRLAGRVAAAGLDVVDAGTVEDTITLPASPACALLVARHAQTARRAVGDALAPADVAALDAPGAIDRLGRSAATSTATRLLVVAAPAREGGQGRSMSSMR